MRIRPPILISLIINGVLGGTVGYLECSTPRPLDAPVVQTPPPSPEPSFSPSISAPATLQWSALESDDYPTYIANLRKFGCPESTIRDIILADVHALYARKRDALSAESLEPSNLPRVLAALQEEESHLLNRLLGIRLPSPQASALAQSQTPPASTAPTPAVTGSESVPTTASMPLAFARVKANTLKLNERQQASLERLCQTFVQQIGGPNQNPDDPLYLERWQQAQATADTQLQTLLGDEVYSRYQIESRHQARQ